MIERLLSRKFLAAMAALLSASVLCWFKRIDAGVYATVMVATIGAYVTANVVQKKTAVAVAPQG